MVIVTRACGTGESNGGAGVYGWTTPANVQVDDANSAHVHMTDNGDESFYLYAHNFGFAIPDNAVVTDVSFSYSRRAEYNNRFKECNRAMHDASSNFNSVDTPDGTYLTTAYVTRTHNGDSSYWHTTLNPALVNSANFGVGIRLAIVIGGSVTAAYIQYVSCTVTYILSEVDFSIGRATSSPHGIVDEVVVLSEVKSPQSIRKYWGWSTGKL
jgi:hypothetical protein